MKKTIIFLCLIVFAYPKGFTQEITGSITFQDDQLTVIKLYGTHEERGFAYGYLLADEIVSLYENYVKTQFGSFLGVARQIIQEGVHISIDNDYINEAMAVAAGIDSSGHEGIDYIDILVANSMLDIQGLANLFDSVNISNGCSSLMSWGKATEGTLLEGKSLISRHLDWTPNSYLINNQVIAIHFPSEVGLQPWLQIGFCGQITVLSGLNNSGLSAFQHMLSDFYGNGSLNKGYEPIWFSLRKALESIDYNNDGANNILDVKAVLKEAENGYADGFIVTALAPNTGNCDSSVALVAELTPQDPTHTYRGNDYPDSIPGDNLYAANFEIKRNDHMHFCPRYNAIVSNIDQGVLINDSVNWNLMKSFSNSGSHNIQFMQIIPESRILKLAYHNSISGAYLNTPIEFNLDDLFTSPENYTEVVASKDNMFLLSPNPANTSVEIKFFNNSDTEASVKIISLQGTEVFSKKVVLPNKSWIAIEIDTTDFPPGFYICRLKTKQHDMRSKLIISR